MTPEYEKLQRIIDSEYFKEYMDTLYKLMRPPGMHIWEMVLYDTQEFLLDVIKELDNEQ